MNIRQLVTVIVFFSIFVMSARISMDTDTWWHLRAGQWMVENREILQTDLFSFTRLGESWQYPGWLFEIPMYIIYDWFGPGGLNLLTALMVTLSYIFLWFTLRGGVFLRTWIMILSAAISGVYWSARPHLITLLFTAIFMHILESGTWNPTQKNLRRLWLLPVLMVLWVNSHGGFAVGFILCAIYAFSQLVNWIWTREIRLRLVQLSRKPALLFQSDYWLFWVSLSLIIAASINPSGVNILNYPFKTVSIVALQENIQEWQSPNFHELSVQPFIWMLLALLAGIGISKKRLALSDFLLLSVFTYMAFLAGRNLALFALVSAPILARHTQAISRLVGKKINLHTEEKSSLGLLAINLLLLFVLGYAGFLKIAAIYPDEVNRTAFQKFLPLEAIEEIRHKLPEGRLFNSYNWGGYIIWELPESPVFVDGRTDLYNDEVISQWYLVYQAQPGWQEILDRWKVGWVLLEKEAPLVRVLDEEGWKRLYVDELAVIYKR